ncbi:MAG: PD-(D/E)XK nuclease family protein, partial [Candidatus Izemoplasmatales bacterium]|nr:PD-(D/E)XK nuclease family protein [Candidatus Izemoplasmatales bacterium]
KIPLLRLPIGIELKRRLRESFAWESVHHVVEELHVTHPHKAMISSFAHEYLRAEAFDYPELINFFISEKQVEPLAYTNVVKICDFNDIWFEDHVYLHLHNAADGLFPMFLQDNTFLSDQEKTQLGLLTSIQENQRMKRTVAFQLEQVHHLTLYTISQRDGKQLSPLDFTCNRSSCKNKREEQIRVFHSQKEAMLRFSKASYHQQTYGQVSKDYFTLRPYFLDMIHKYDPQFKLISKNLNQRLLGKNVTLSATAIELFYHCRFHYLLSHLLKLDDHVPSQALDLGNFTHQVLYESFSKKTLPPEKKTNFSSLLSRGDGYLSWFKNNVEVRLNEVINEL